MSFRPFARAAALALALAAAAPLARPLAAPAHPQTFARCEVPTELFEVVKVVDGDTLHIQRGGQVEKLRLLSVDTEEKLTPGMQSSPSKPQTVFGEETRLWAEAFLDEYRDAAGKLSIGLRFPGGVEARDVYGRLLCHVVLPDGIDFNLLLVELGKSPYFNKYGNSLLDHERFVAAQERARHLKLGIWDPSTNVPADPELPSARRDYARLMPWWQVRADAIEGFRTRAAAGEAGLLSAEDAEAVKRAAAAGATVEVFGTPDRYFDERDGSLTVLLRSSAKDGAVRVVIPADAVAAFEGFDLRGLGEEFRQNYAYVKGTLEQGPRGPQLVTRSPAAWRRAGPEPKLP
ncbi:MAG: thermonuclease family protein [Planctomycetes bacterium]|nr:thermonuclease family protein [Planctomycetota bacterium]